MSIQELAASLDTLDPDTVRAELDNLNCRADALRVLLRSAIARQRCVNRGAGAKVQGQRKPGVGQGGAGVVHA